jgi:hypothetical protein
MEFKLKKETCELNLSDSDYGQAAGVLNFVTG